MKKYIYLFEEGQATQKKLLGGKGASLAEMTQLDLPVPPGMTITTEACDLYYDSNQKLPEFLLPRIKEYLSKIEKKTEKKFGDNNNPLLLSVRSGSATSMPGMMDTILNLGLNDQSVKGLAKITNDKRFAYDCYRRFIQMFANIVLKIDSSKFTQALNKLKQESDREKDLNLTTSDLKELINRYKNIIKAETNSQFPQNPLEQLITAIEAIFGSWNNQRAIAYREANNLDHDLGTAVNVQAMVFGNKNQNSGTGVLFTRNPSTGEKELYGEYLLNAQGEDVVGGIRTPKSIDNLQKQFPEVFEQLKEVTELLENNYQDLQDIEFTIEDGQLYLLQTRTGKRTAEAAIKIAVDMVEEDIIDKEEALLRVKPNQIEKILHKRIDPKAETEIITQGLAASPGAATGQIVFSVEEAKKLSQQGEKVILVSVNTTPEDIEGVMAAQGVLTTRGGMTSHAAVVARGMGKACVCGCKDIKIDFEKQELLVNDRQLKEGDYITIDGGTGKVILGEVDKVDPKLSSEAEQLLDWADEFKSLDVYVNADNERDIKQALQFGAQGIGLCRTEHMFRTEDRLAIIRDLIVSESKEEEEKKLDKLESIQRQDFAAIFSQLEHEVVTVRLLDPPLHEFLPDLSELKGEVAKLEYQGLIKKAEKKRKLLNKVEAMQESNAMLGFRGARLGIIKPKIYEMQVRAMFKAVIDVAEEGIKVTPKIMLPLINHVNEIKILRNKLETVADQLLADSNFDLNYKLGTMMELPRACLTADEIAKEAEFFSFGTNDLTQTTFGISRDDAESKFLSYYLKEGILSDNPFISLDQAGVGRLIEIATNLGRKTNPGLNIGICGEHGGEAKSIALSQQYNLDYVSCSPYRVPVARLAAAQAKLRQAKTDQEYKRITNLAN